jgi:hemolysin III
VAGWPADAPAVHRLQRPQAPTHDPGRGAAAGCSAWQGYHTWYSFGSHEAQRNQGATALLKRWHLREPVSGLSHLAGAAFATLGLILLLVVARGKPWHLTGFAIYGATLVFLYLASTVYHLAPVGPRWQARLLALDQVAIYALIAGTYTPLCLVQLRGAWGWSLLGMVWGLACIGVVLRLSWRSAPSWLPLPIYLVMGWLCIIAAGPLTGALPAAGLLALLAGGLLYTVGAVVFVTERPRLWPGRFGAHDLWHMFVLGGSACHFAVMLGCVAPAP